MAHTGTDTWDIVGQLVEWLDDKTPVSGDTATLLRVLKISEEAGEVAEALHGVLGSNPRKGSSHTWQDVQAELCDVILTSMVALRSLNPEAGKLFEHHLQSVGERSLRSA